MVTNIWNSATTNMAMETAIDKETRLVKELSSILKAHKIHCRELLTIHQTDDLYTSFDEFLKWGDTAFDGSNWDAISENNLLTELMMDIGIDLDDLINLYDSMDQASFGSCDMVSKEQKLTPSLAQTTERKQQDQVEKAISTESPTVLPVSPSTQQTVAPIIQSDSSSLTLTLVYNTLSHNDNEHDDATGIMELHQVAKAPATESAARIPTRQHIRQTTIPTIQPSDSPLVPARTYNNRRLDDNWSTDLTNDADSMDLYAWYLKVKRQPLFKAIQTPGKVISTDDWNLARNELKYFKIVQRIENLKSAQLWSFKQLQRHTSVPRTNTHWDHLLAEMKWMRTDFKEERKWKIATAYMISKAVMEWHQTSGKVYRQRRSAPAPITAYASLFSANTTTMMDTPRVTADTASEDIVGQHTDERDMNNNVTIATALEQYLKMESDRTHTITILPVTQDQQLDIITTPLSNNALYAPPDPNANDSYFNESEYGRIVPVTKLLSFKKRDSGKRTTNDKLALTQQAMKYTALANSPPDNHHDYPTSFFTLDEPGSQPLPPPRAPPAPPTPASGFYLDDYWTNDDNLCLASLVMQFSFNWDLICDIFNSIRTPLAVEKRTPWELHQRWRQNELTTLSGQVNQVYATKLQEDLSSYPTMVKFDNLRKIKRQYSIFEAIKKVRTNRKKAQRSTHNASSSRPSPTRTIAVHGMDSNGKYLPTPMELGVHKVVLDQQQKALQNSQLYKFNGRKGSSSEISRSNVPVAKRKRSAPPSSSSPLPTTTKQRHKPKYKQRRRS